MPSAAATTAGLLKKIIGTTSGAKLHATATVSRPVANRSMIEGAARAPSTPKTPAAVSTSPICSGGKPPWMRRSTAAKKSAFTTRFISAAQTVSTRRNGS